MKFLKLSQKFNFNLL